MCCIYMKAQQTLLKKENHRKGLCEGCPIATVSCVTTELWHRHYKPTQ